MEDRETKKSRARVYVARSSLQVCTGSRKYLPSLPALFIYLTCTGGLRVTVDEYA